jgi:ribosomal protein S18 acetylase RimI-like enzyme
MTIHLVPCTQEYWEFVRQLRTDPRTAQGFIQQVEITPDQQCKYMSSHWQEYFIALVDDEPAGFVGSVGNDIRVCTHPDFQNRGVGSYMIKELSKILPNAVAKIKIDNQASAALFRANGYVPTYIIYEKAAHASCCT